MKRRGLPRIDAADLREHADRARVDRIWNRIENDLAVPEPSHTKSFSMSLLGAAAAAAFVGGVVCGKVLLADPASTSVAPAPVGNEHHVEIYAAGSRLRTFDLPGGGQVTLQQGSIVEIARDDVEALTLRLIQGEASFTAEPTGRKSLAIVAGKARVSAQAGSVLWVRRNASDMDVEVASGAANVESPAGSNDVASGEKLMTVPLEPAVAANTPTPISKRSRPVATSLPSDPPVEVQEPVLKVASGPEWLAKFNAGEKAEGFKLLKEQPGGIDGAIQSARSGGELYSIHDVARANGDSAWVRALARIVESFPSDPNAVVAASQLALHYAKSNPELAAKYGAIAAKGPLAENIACKAMLATTNKDEAAKRAQEYLAKYPDGGQCTEEAKRLAGGDESADDEADDEPAPAPSPAPPSANPTTAPAAPAAPEPAAPR